MALAANTVFEIQSTATAGNVNGGGFNPNNAGMLTDLTTDSNTANTAAPVVSSASYNFVAGDVGNWLYIKSGTNWTPGWYKIASVASNKATLSAAVGSANVVQVTNNRYATNTVIGCATVGTPTGGTFTIDYSQSTACITSTSVSDYASVGSSTNLTSVTAAFTPVMVGNLFHLNNAGVGGFGLVGWYEIVSYTNATTVVTDRTTNNGTAMVSGQGKVGGALSLASSDDAVFELAVSSATASARFFVKGGSSITYTLGGAVQIGAAGNAVWPCILEAYASQRGDRPTAATRPIFDGAANGFRIDGANWELQSMIFTGTPASGTNLANTANTKAYNCKFINTSTTAGRIALSIAANGFFKRCEIISYRGVAVQSNSSASGNLEDCYIHDSDIGVGTSSGATFNLKNCVISDNVTAAIQNTGALATTAEIKNCTLYGAENKLGLGMNLATGATAVRFTNNIVYGFTTGITAADTQAIMYDDYNNYFNNTNDVSAAGQWQKGANDIALNPNFTSIAQLTGSTATTSGSVLTQAAGNFSTVTDNVDFVYIKSGTGVTVGKYLITSHTTTTITLDIAPGTDATADKVWQITTGHNFAVGTNMANAASPGAFPAALTTAYNDIGAVQRQPLPYSKGRVVNA